MDWYKCIKCDTINTYDRIPLRYDKDSNRYYTECSNCKMKFYLK